MDEMKMTAEHFNRLSNVGLATCQQMMLTLEGDRMSTIMLLVAGAVMRRLLDIGDRQEHIVIDTMPDVELDLPSVVQRRPVINNTTMIGDLELRKIMDERDRLQSALAEASVYKRQLETTHEANRELAEQVNELQAVRDRLNTSLAQTEAELFQFKRSNQAAAQTLTNLGYTYTDGAELWKPPLGNAPAFTREPDGIRIVRAEDYRGEDGSIQARYDVFDGKSGGSYQAITVWQRSARVTEDRPHFAAVERRLLANAPAEPEEKPARLPLTVICDAERLCMKLAGEMSVTPPAHGTAWRNGTGDQPKVWRLACSLYQEITGIDAWIVAADYDEIPF